MPRCGFEMTGPAFPVAAGNAAICPKTAPETGPQELKQPLFCIFLLKKILT